MKGLISDLPQRAASAEKATKKFLRKLSMNSPGNLDKTVHCLHDEIFSRTDCLSCANCCRMLGPRLTDKDIERLSAYLRLKPSVFTEKYVILDEDGDYIFRNMPCPFLLSDNRCDVYEERPKACREYPHTRRKRFYQLIPVTLRNTFICPAVFELVEELKTRYMIH